METLIAVDPFLGEVTQTAQENPPVAEVNILGTLEVMGPRLLVLGVVGTIAGYLIGRVWK